MGVLFASIHRRGQLPQSIRVPRGPLPGPGLMPNRPRPRVRLPGASPALLVPRPAARLRGTLDSLLADDDAEAARAWLHGEAPLEDEAALARQHEARGKRGAKSEDRSSLAARQNRAAQDDGEKPAPTPRKKLHRRRDRRRRDQIPRYFHDLLLGDLDAYWLGARDGCGKSSGRAAILSCGAMVQECGATVKQTARCRIGCRAALLRAAQSSIARAGCRFHDRRSAPFPRRPHK